MRSRIGLFLLVGFVATAFDFGVFSILTNNRSSFIEVLIADVVALISAALASYFLNRYITFKGDSDARWVSSPLLFALVAAFAGSIDIAIVSGLLSVLDNSYLLLIKLIAVLFSAPIRWLAYRFVLFKQIRRELSHRVDRGPSPGKHRVAIVLPAYNESERIIKTIESLKRILKENVIDDYELIVVDDGSSDNTSELAEQSGAKVVKRSSNSGKGAAIREGMLASDSRAIIFTDADLAYPPELIVTVLDEIESGWDVVVGSRRHSGTVVEVRTTLLRRIGGWVVNRLTYLVLLGQFRDTQCGIKGFRGDVGKSIASRLRIDRFGFDVEIFLMAEQDRYSLEEIPVNVVNREGSSVRMFKDTGILIADLIRIRRSAGRGEYEISDGVPEIE